MAPSSMACDNCRRRKVRCTRTRPCQKCQDVSLNCTYTSLPQRKGPKGSNARVLNSLRGLWPEVSSSIGPGGNYPQQHPLTGAILHGSDGLENGHASSPAPSLTISHSSGSSTRETQSSYPPSPPNGATRRISSTVLGAHIGLFLQHLHPIMPVIDSRTMADCANPEILQPRRYAYLVALSAATHLQLNLDIGDLDPLETNTNIISGQDLITEAVRTLTQFDPLESPHTDTLLTMFFLFCAYGNLDKSDYAWHYLSQTISFLQILNMDKEAMYGALPFAEAEARRRIYWLIFITERAYALQTGRPVMLRSTIRKPSVFSSEVPALLYGFVSLANLFQQMVPDFYDWNAVAIDGPQGSTAITSMYQSISSSPCLLGEVSEVHQVDLIISQQWLLVCLWNYLIKKCLLQPQDSTTILPTQVPLMAGRCALACLSSVSSASVDAHGIGMEQKLYDIGQSITQLAPGLFSKALSAPRAVSAAETKDLLKSILDVLSRTRGCQSYLFSSLLEKSRNLLEVDHLPPALLGPKGHTHTDSFHPPGPETEGENQESDMLEPEALECQAFKPLAETESDFYLQY